MNPMTVLMAIWAVLTIVLAGLLIYRSALTMHEDNQLFLDRAEDHLEREQQQLTQRMDRLRPYLTVLGTSSGVLLLMIAGLWLWRGWKGM